MACAPGVTLLAIFIEMKLHGFAVPSQQHQAGAGIMFGTHRAEQIGRLRSLIRGPRGDVSLSSAQR